MRRVTGRTYYDAMGYSTVATILNDLATSTACPLTVNAFWASGRSAWFADEEKQRDLAKGWADACLDTGARWGGGESQTLFGQVNAKTAVLAGSATGIIHPKDDYPGDGHMLEDGDCILLAPSTGIHDNGLTLSRQIARSLPQGYRTKLSDGMMYGEALLVASRQYSPLVQELLGKVDIHYLAHITGHGWRKLMRAQRNDLRYIIDQVPQPQPVFDFIERHYPQTETLLEMYSTFNMGAGYALFMPESDAQTASEIAEGTQVIHS